MAIWAALMGKGLHTIHLDHLGVVTPAVLRNAKGGIASIMRADGDSADDGDVGAVVVKLLIFIPLSLQSGAPQVAT